MKNYTVSLLTGLSADKVYHRQVVEARNHYHAIAQVIGSEKAYGASHYSTHKGLRFQYNNGFCLCKRSNNGYPYER